MGWLSGNMIVKTAALSKSISNTLASPVEQFEQSMTPGFPEGEQDRLEAQLQQLIANVPEIGSIPRKGKIAREANLELSVAAPGAVERWFSQAPGASCAVTSDFAVQRRRLVFYSDAR